MYAFEYLLQLELDQIFTHTEKKEKTYSTIQRIKNQERTISTEKLQSAPFYNLWYNLRLVSYNFVHILYYFWTHLKDSAQLDIVNQGLIM